MLYGPEQFHTDSAPSEKPGIPAHTYPAECRRMELEKNYHLR